MKDITISAKRIKQEGIHLFACFSVSFVINCIAIIGYSTNWSELFTSLPYVVVFALIIFGVWGLLRFVYFFLKKYFQIKKNNTADSNPNQ